ncbi:UDP-glycosyltransferase UGT5-like [Atheta coriaria]|uniref:UDP-glycosyltransferase UGT5-like n=1 Tax=Dalotia coriaria TaxID=877792 RepID=UPI0031F3D3AD
MKAFTVPLLLLSVCLYPCYGARILAVIAVPSYSHQVFFRPLWREYLARGHELTLITTDPMSSEDHHPNLRQIDVSMVYDNAEATFDHVMNLRSDKFAEVNFLFEYVLNATRRELMQPDVHDLLMNKSHEFDLLIIEDIAPEMYVFKHRFDVPCIAVASFDVPPWTHEFIGNPVHPLIYPTAIIPINNLHDGVIKRFVIVLFDFIVRKYYEYYLIARMDHMISETLPGNYPSVLELQQRADMLFTNANPVFSCVRPFTQTTVSLAGGFHTNRAQNISKDLLTFLDDSSEGVIYFSLGTNVKSKLLSKKLRNIFLDAFRQLPYKILWKFELDSLENQPENVKIIKWCPQQAVLRHKNIKAFISQGGLQSLEESLLSGVPVVTIPFFFDQEGNAKQVIASGIGVELMYETLTVAELKAAILEVILNAKYRNMARKHAEFIMDRPMTPLQDAIWHTEYLLRHGNVKHLKIASIPFYQYYYLDLMAITLCVLCLFMYITYFLIKTMIGNLNNNQKISKRKIQ